MAVTCKERAAQWVHTYAVGGSAFAVIPMPLPGMTSAGLAAAETHMVYWIARIYGEELTGSEIIATASSVGLAGVGLKLAAMEIANYVPVVGWLVKPMIAGSAIEAIGHLIIDHFEDKYPGKMYTVQADIESSMKKK